MRLPYTQSSILLFEQNSQDKEVAIACALVDNSCIVYKLTNSNEETSSDARGLK